MSFEQCSFKARRHHRPSGKSFRKLLILVLHVHGGSVPERDIFTFGKERTAVARRNLHTDRGLDLPVHRIYFVGYFYVVLV